MRWIFLGCVLLSPALAVAEPELAADAGTATASPLAGLDELWARRDAADAPAKMEAALSAALRAAPNDYAILWRAARWKWWVADGASGELKKQLGKEGWNLGERAVAANPNGVEGQHFLAVGIGAYSQAVGIFKALTEGLEGKFNEHLDLAVKLDPKFFNCGPLIAKGRYFYELPWPKRDLGKSVEMLNKAIASCPASIRAYVYLAETQLKEGDAKKAKETLGRISGDVAYDPPEGRRTLGMAKIAQGAVDAELK